MPMQALAPDCYSLPDECYIHLHEHAHAIAITVKPALSDHVWAKKNLWSLNGGGLLIEVEMYGVPTFETGPSGLNRGGL
jgi:hypothetical protein